MIPAITRVYSSYLDIYLGSLPLRCIYFRNKGSTRVLGGRVVYIIDEWLNRNLRELLYIASEKYISQNI